MRNYVYEQISSTCVTALVRCVPIIAWQTEESELPIAPTSKDALTVCCLYQTIESSQHGAA